jgi:hypothetical protein
MKHPFSGIDQPSDPKSNSNETPPADTVVNPTRRRWIAGTAAATSLMIFGCKTTQDARLSDEGNRPRRRRRPRPGTGVSTEAVGEEGGDYATTEAIGEEGGGFSTTQGLNEEGGLGMPSTEAVGEDGSDAPAATRRRGEDGDGRPRISTQALGEEGGDFASTEAVGEEGGGWASTEAVGEEGGWVTSQALGEEGADDRRPDPGTPPPVYTTQAVGEEGGSGRITTRRANEEGGSSRPRPPRYTTEAVGEEGGGRITSMAVGEEGGRGMGLVEQVPATNPDDMLMTTMATGEEGGAPDWWQESNERAAFFLIHEATEALMTILKELKSKKSKQQTYDVETRIKLLTVYYEGDAKDKTYEQKVEIFRAFFELGFYDATVVTSHVFVWRQGDGSLIPDDSDNTFFYSCLQTLQQLISLQPNLAAKATAKKK